MVTTIPAGTLRLLLALIGYRAKARKELRREPPMVPRRPPRPAAGLTRRVEGARLTRWQIASRRTWETSRPRRADHVQVETLTPPGWHGLRYAALSYMPYYNRAAVLTCAASRRGASGVIVDCIGLVLLAVERVNRRKSPCKAPCAVLRHWSYNCMDWIKDAVKACIGLYCSKAK